MGRKNSKKKKPEKHRVVASSRQKELKGVLELTRAGMGFVTVNELKTDVLIRPSDHFKYMLAIGAITGKIFILSKSGSGSNNGEYQDTIHKFLHDLFLNV